MLLTVLQFNQLVVPDCKNYLFLLIDLSNPNLPEVETYIKELSDKIINKIKIEIKNKCLSIIIKIGSRNGVSFLNIFLRFFRDNNIKLACIGAHEIKQKINIKDVVVQYLNKYEVNLNRVISITSDERTNFDALISIFDDDDHYFSDLTQEIINKDNYNKPFLQHDEPSLAVFDFNFNEVDAAKYPGESDSDIEEVSALFFIFLYFIM